MIVVADTSVILNLCCVGQQELLPPLFGEIFIPPEVKHEFERASRAYARFAWVAVPTWIREQRPVSVPSSLQQNAHLDAGEIAAIALALELAASALLIDEAEGRQAARRQGLTVIGTLGVLVRARQSGLLQAIAPILDQLEHQANFWIAVEIRAEALRLVGEAG